MIDLTKTTAAKTDQQNFDDYSGGRTRTIKVTKVSLLGEKDQPISINFEGDEGKPYKPCLSMRRVLVHCWGADGAQYIGRSMTLYGDPKVKFGGSEVGGIRISHLSNIDKEMTMALTATRASRKPFTVKPLNAALSPDVKAAPLDQDTINVLIDEGNEAAERGTTVLQAFWERMKSPPRQKELLSHLEGWKVRAKEIDDSNVNLLNAG